MFGPGRTNLSDGYTYSEYDCDFSRSIIDKGTPVSDGDTHGAVVYLLIICCIAALGAAAVGAKLHRVRDLEIIHVAAQDEHLAVRRGQRRCRGPSRRAA